MFVHAMYWSEVLNTTSDENSYLWRDKYFIVKSPESELAVRNIYFSRANPGSNVGFCLNRDHDKIDPGCLQLYIISMSSLRLSQFDHWNNQVSETVSTVSMRLVKWEFLGSSQNHAYPVILYEIFSSQLARIFTDSFYESDSQFYIVGKSTQHPTGRFRDHGIRFNSVHFSVRYVWTMCLNSIKNFHFVKLMKMYPFLKHCAAPGTLYLSKDKAYKLCLVYRLVQIGQIMFFLL